MACALLLNSCATIISGSSKTLKIDSTPSEAHISIFNQYGESVYEGTTTAKCLLKTGKGYFRNAKYTIKIEKEGYSPLVKEVSTKLNAWYIGNVVFGGLIGLVAVDPVTGAMYTFNQYDFTFKLNEEAAQPNDSTVITAK